MRSLRAAVVTLLLLGAARMARAQDLDGGVAPAAEADAAPVAATEPMPATHDDELRERVDNLERIVAAQAAHTQAIERALREDAKRHSFLTISGYTQIDVLAHDQSSSDQLNEATREPLNQERIFVRRARLRSDFARWGMRASMEIDGNTVRGPALKLVSAEIGIEWLKYPMTKHVWFDYSLGLMKIPFGAEVPSRTQDRVFLEETGLARALFPGDYDAGMRVGLRWRWLRGSVAVMNGDPVGELGGYAGRNPNKAFDVVERLGVDTAISEHARVTAGVSFDHGTGFHAGTSGTKDLLVWRDANEDGRVQLTELQVIPGQAATPSANFDRDAIGADARFVALLAPHTRLEVAGELAWATNLDRGLEPADPIATGRDLREFGYAVSATITWRMLVGAVRWDAYDPDADARDQQGSTLVPEDRSYGTLAVVLGSGFDSMHAVIEYDHVINPLGRTMGGTPTTLAADTLTLRYQVAY